MEENKKPKRKFRKSILTAKILALCALGYGLHRGGVVAIEQAQAGLSAARAIISERFSEVKIVREYLPQEQKPLGQIVKEAAKRHGVSSLLLTALITQESGQNLRADRMRYEPHLHGRFKCPAWANDAECKAYATSWGLSQVVYGFWKEHCGLTSYSDLLDPEVNLNCGASILGECLKRNDKMKKIERYRTCLGQYNGDRTGKYSNEVLGHLTDIVIEREL